MLILPMLIAILTGLVSAGLVLVSGHGVFWAFFAYSLLGGAGLFLASLAVVASDAYTRNPT
ncbi:MAG: hypothetical protein JJU08_08370 [Rhodobacteraceae bacterium]|nr:hypothetical protein [Paracoccaceae bacterium]